MRYLETLTNEIKNLNGIRPTQFEGLIWNERVKGYFGSVDYLKGIVGAAIKNERLIFQCNSCRDYCPFKLSLTQFNDELDGHKAMRCKRCSKLFKQAKISSKELEESNLVNIGAIRR